MLNEKKISKSGSITIPSHIRREYGIESGEKLKIETNNDGDLILKRIVGSCIMCGENENLIKVNDKYICKTCIEKINKQSETEQA